MIKRHNIIDIVTNICSLLLAAIFVFSGFTKAVDPVGGGIKIGEYLAAAGINALGYETLLETFSVAESALEFLLGVHLLLGIRRKVASLMTLLLMLFMTAITAYIAATNVVSDCGCFGEAVHLSNGATLIKNVILLAASVVVFVFSARIKSLMRKETQLC